MKVAADAHWPLHRISGNDHTGSLFGLGASEAFSKLIEGLLWKEVPEKGFSQKIVLRMFSRKWTRSLRSNLCISLQDLRISWQNLCGSVYKFSLLPCSKEPKWHKAVSLNEL